MMTIYSSPNGETWETRPSTYGFYQGMPCKITEMRGNIATFVAPDSVVLHSEPMSDGWTCYYLDTTDVELHNGIVELANIYAAL